MNHAKAVYCFGSILFFFSTQFKAFNAIIEQSIKTEEKEEQAIKIGARELGE